MKTYQQFFTAQLRAGTNGKALGLHGSHGGSMSWQQSIEDRIREVSEKNRDLATLVRHHDKRVQFLLLQVSDEELKRLGIDEPNRNADDWFERVLRKVDTKLDAFMNAHARLVGAKKRGRMTRFLDNLQTNLRLQMRERKEAMRK